MVWPNILTSHFLGLTSIWSLKIAKRIQLHSKITMAGEVVPYYTVTALVPTLK